jgi:hypothetical protein
MSDEYSTSPAERNNQGPGIRERFELMPKQRMILWAGISCVPQLLACLMLLWALKPHNPYGYFILLRWVCCAVFAGLAFQAFARDKQGWGWVLGITAVIYNPIIRVHLTREQWSIINVLTIGIAVASIFALTLRADRNNARSLAPAEQTEQRERAELEDGQNVESLDTESGKIS